jgi:hypothetical protein
MLFPALCVTSSSLVAVYEFGLSSLTVNDIIAELLVAETAGVFTKGKVYVSPDDVVIAIPDDGAFSPM